MWHIVLASIGLALMYMASSACAAYFCIQVRFAVWYKIDRCSPARAAFRSTSLYTAGCLETR